MLSDARKTRQQLTEELDELRQPGAKQVKKRGEPASDQMYRNLFDLSPDGIMVLDRKGTVKDCNRAFFALTGYSRDEIIGKHISRLPTLNARVIPKYLGIFADILRGKDADGLEFDWIRKDGSLRVGEIRTSLVRTNGRISGVQVVLRDITDRKAAEYELELQAELLDAELHSVYVHDFDGNFIYVNRAAYESHGYTKEELLSMNLGDLDTPESAQLIPARMNELLMKGSSVFEASHYHKDGFLIALEVHTTTVTVHGRRLIMSIAHDITERKRLAEQVRQSQVMASLGEMTAGIAHEVNNPLAAILLYSELIDRSGFSPAAKKDLKVIRGEAKRASGIMKNLLNYSRKAEPVIRRLDIRKTISKVIDIRKYQEGVKNINIDVNLINGPLRVRGNNAQLIQVFMNILVNAEEAVEKSDDKRIAVTAETDDGQVRISVADTGGGIPEANLKRVFVPFFSTKPTGKGTGLGLATCHSIVTAHGGSIWAANNDMGGATVTVELPLVK